MLQNFFWCPCRDWHVYCLEVFRSVFVRSRAILPSISYKPTWPPAVSTRDKSSTSKDIFIKILPSYLHEELHKTVYFIKPVKHSLLTALLSLSRKRAHDSHHIILWVSQFPTQSPNDSSNSLVLTPKRFGPRAIKLRGPCVLKSALEAWNRRGRKPYSEAISGAHNSVLDADLPVSLFLVVTWCDSPYRQRSNSSAFNDLPA